MIWKIAGVLALLVLTLVGFIALRPSDFRISRSTVIASAPAEVFTRVNDFHQWEAWSPWAKLDPAIKITYEGPASGVGSVFRWAGNDEVGVGSMTILESRPDERVLIRLEFLKPFPADNQVEFVLVPEGPHTRVTWTMSGKNNFVAKAVGLFIDCDQMVGGMYEKGLANLKGLVEGTPKT
jgi:uncharacterized protein YndB with AHSA1/START domain